MDATKLATTLEPYAIKLRRELHQHPELSFQERETSRKICEELDQIGIPYDIVGDYNVIATLHCGPGKKLAIRGDMDALTIMEALDVPWKSQRDGIMHACGHDCHVASLLATAKGLASWKSQLQGTYYFCFQQAEEESGGATECVQYLQKQGGVDKAIALHVDAGLDVGKIDIKEGARCSGCIEFQVTIHGHGGHGARPDRCVDSIEIGTMVYSRLKQIPIYHHDPFRRCLVSICTFQGGNTNNVIPDTCQMTGTVRYYGYGDGKLIFDKIEQISRDTAISYGGTASVSCQAGTEHPIINDGHSIALAHSVCETVGLEDVPMNPAAGSDNFSEFLHAFSGCYGFIGAKSYGPGASESHHNPNFDIDEGVLAKTIAFYLEYAKTLERSLL